MNKIELIEEYVKNECQNNKLGESFFDQHVRMVKDFSLQLGEHYHANLEILQIAAYFHDIAAIRNIENTTNHHIEGSDIAHAKLCMLGYDRLMIQSVCDCIQRHSHPIKIGHGSIEAVCLSNADAISKIANPIYWLYFVYNVRNRSYSDGKKWFVKETIHTWDTIDSFAQQLVQNQYAELCSILR